MESRQVSQKDIWFECQPILDMLEKFESQLYSLEPVKYKELLVPEYLKSLLYVFFFYDKSKVVSSENHPSDTIYVNTSKDEMDNTIEMINTHIQVSTEGFLQGMPSETEIALRDPKFHFLLLLVLHLKGTWHGSSRKDMLEFHNRNGLTKKVRYFKFRSVKAFTKDNRINVIVPYRVNPDLSFFLEVCDHVIFSKPLKDDEKYTNFLNAYVPELEFQVSEKMGKNTMLCLKYKQDKDGFEAAVYCGMVGTGMTPKERVYFDEPFTIEIFSKGFKVLEIDVNNL